MPDTVRQQIVNAIKTRFAGIKIANGYNTNLGDWVYCWKATNIENSQTATINYRDLTADIVEYTGKCDHHMTVEVEVVTAATAAAHNEIRKMLADVFKAIGVDWTWGGLAITTKITAHGIMDIEHMGRILGGGKVTFEVHYRTGLFEI